MVYFFAMFMAVGACVFLLLLLFVCCFIRLGGIHDFDKFVNKFDLFVLVPAVLYKSGLFLDSQQRHRAHKYSDSSADKHDYLKPTITQHLAF
jgi:hypothetical protein